ncbi:MAG: hypothetical protein ACLP1X_29920 [Polyangiaceae bacterium]
MIPIVSEAREAVEKALEDAELRVGRMLPTPGARELSGRLSKYRHIVAGWIHRSPTDNQIAAMRDCIAEVSRLAINATPTARTRAPK